MPSRASAFRHLHVLKDLLVLPNAWDAGTARLTEFAGAKAIATTSAGMAWALGIPDGYKLQPDAVIAVAKNIRRAVDVPVSIDIEDGYSPYPEEVAQLVSKLVDEGVDGINIEDGSDPVDLLARKIGAIRSMLDRRSADVFVNARTDVFLRKLAKPSELVDETVSRGTAYRAAGADGLFVPAISASDDIRQVVANVDLPINVMAVSGLPPARELQALGVKRLSAGSGLAQLAMADLLHRGKEFLDEGRSDRFEASLSFASLQKIFDRR
jgi:2-methylisocitrate lyase-like PEP mutase family enzyme